MTAKDVYNIAKALSEQESKALYRMLSNDVLIKIKTPKCKIITQNEAIAFLLKTQFNKF